MTNVWFKCNPSDFLNGMADLEADERGVYVSIIFMMYDQGGSVVDDPRRLARRCGTSTRRFNQVKKRLLDEGKIIAHEGRFFNKRVFTSIYPQFISNLSLNYLVLIFPNWRKFNDLAWVKILEPRTKNKINNKSELSLVPPDGTPDKILFDYVTDRYGQAIWASWFSRCHIADDVLYPPSALVEKKISSEYETVLADVGLMLGEVAA